MAGNPNIDTLTASTIKKYWPTLISTIMDQQIILKTIDKYGGCEERSGGTSILEPLLYDQNTTIQSYRGYDLFNLTPSNPLTGNQQEWKQVVGTISQSGMESFQNQSVEQRVNLLDARVRELEEKFVIYFSQKLFADGSGNGGKDIIGLPGMIDSGGSWSTYGGIDSNLSVNSWWRNKYQGSAGIFSGSLNGTTRGRYYMTNMYNSLMVGADRPDLIVTDQTIYEQYEFSLDQNYRTMDLEVGKRGYKALEFKGTPLIWDINCQAGYMWFLNLMKMKIIFGKNKKFARGEFMTMPNQDAKVASIIVYLATINLNRKRQGVITGFTAT